MPGCRADRRHFAYAKAAHARDQVRGLAPAWRIRTPVPVAAVPGAAGPGADARAFAWRAARSARVGAAPLRSPCDRDRPTRGAATTTYAASPADPRVVRRARARATDFAPASATRRSAASGDGSVAVPDAAG